MQDSNGDYQRIDDVIEVFLIREKCWFKKKKWWNFQNQAGSGDDRTDPITNVNQVLQK